MRRRTEAVVDAERLRWRREIQTTLTSMFLWPLARRLRLQTAGGGSVTPLSSVAGGSGHTTPPPLPLTSYLPCSACSAGSSQAWSSAGREFGTDRGAAADAEFPLKPGPRRTRRRCSRPVCDGPSASRSVPSRQNRLQARLEAILTGRNEPGRAQMVANTAGTALTGAVRTGLQSDPTRRLSRPTFSRQRTTEPPY